MKKQIEVVIFPEGMQIEAARFKGADCQKATEYLEKAFGVITSS